MNMWLLLQFFLFFFHKLEVTVYPPFTVYLLFVSASEPRPHSCCLLLTGCQRRCWMSATYPARREHFLSDPLKGKETSHLPYLAACGDRHRSTVAWFILSSYVGWRSFSANNHQDLTRWIDRFFFILIVCFCKLYVTVFLTE